MNTKTSLKKAFDVSVISTSGVDESHQVSGLTLNGRANLVASLPGRPSGLGAIGLRAARCLLSNSRLALGSLIGDDPDGEAFRAENSRLGLDTSYLFAIPGRATGRQWVFEEASEDRKLIIRQGDVLGSASFERDLSASLEKRFKGMVARSRATVVGHLPLTWTAELLDWGGRMGTQMTLVPGQKQLDGLADLACDVLVLGYAEAVQATRAVSREDAEFVFDKLLRLTPKATWVVQTGGGEHPTYLADRSRGVLWVAEPAILSRIPKSRGMSLSTLGAGDVAAVGLARCLVEGQALEVAWHWASILATAHILGVTFAGRNEAEVWFARHGRTFTPVRERVERRAAA